MGSLELKDVFDIVADLDDIVVKGCNVAVDKDLYSKYLRLYHFSVAMCRKLDEVIEDGEHRLGMEEGSDHGWILPDPDFMREDVDAMKEFLNDLDPFHVQHLKSGRVKASGKLAIGMHYMVELNRLMVKKLFHMFRTTDYLKYHRHLRDRGIKYAGPTSLQEVVDAFFFSAHTKNYTQKYLERHSIPSNWQRDLTYS